MNKTCRIRNSQIVSCNNPNEKNPIGCLREPGWCEPTEIHHCSTAVCVNVISVNWPLIKGSLAQKCFTELTLKRTGLCCLDPLCVRSFPSCFCTSFFFGWTIYTEWMILLSNYNKTLQMSVGCQEHCNHCFSGPFHQCCVSKQCCEYPVSMLRLHYEIRADMWPTVGMWSSALSLSLLSRLQPQRLGKTRGSLRGRVHPKIQHLIK